MYETGNNESPMNNAQQQVNAATYKAELIEMFTDQVKAAQNSDHIVYRTALGKIIREFMDFEKAGDIQTGDLSRDIAEQIYSMKNAVKDVLHLHAIGKTADAVEVYRNKLMSRVAPVALTALPDDLASRIRNILGSRLKCGMNPITVH